MFKNFSKADCLYLTFYVGFFACLNFIPSGFIHAGLLDAMGVTKVGTGIQADLTTIGQAASVISLGIAAILKMFSHQWANKMLMGSITGIIIFFGAEAIIAEVA